MLEWLKTYIYIKGEGIFENAFTLDFNYSTLHINFIFF